MKKLKPILMVSLLTISLFLFVSLSMTGSVRAGENESASDVPGDKTTTVTNGPLETVILGQPGVIESLTGPRAGEPLEIALDFIQASKGELGLTTADLSDVVASQYQSQHTGVTHISLQQRYNGIEIVGATVNVNVAADGSIINLSSRFVGSLSQRVQGTAALTAVEAVEAAAAHLDLTLTEALEIEETSGGVDQAVVLSDGGISLDAIPAKLVYQPGRDGLRLAWDLTIYELDALHWWRIRVDAVTSEVLDQQDLVVHEDFAAQAIEAGHEVNEAANLAAVPHHNEVQAEGFSLAPDDYLVYAIPVESPQHTTPLPPADGRTLETDPATSASPFGWHDTDGNPGPEFTVTEGNNVNAFEDGNNPGFQPDCGGTISCTFPIDLTQHPDTYEAAAVTNLFYWNNVIHDLMYGYGFDEASGNFQENNYGNGGLGSDSVNARAQAPGNCNATFGTPADGSNPTMSMFLCNNASPPRDGDLDNAVIVHEYGHGISNRLTGGPSNVGCLNNSEQMGEGWSDWYGLMMTMEAGDTGPDARGIGTYLFGQPPNGPGIRPAPYSTDFGVNAFTYGDIPGQAIPHGVGFVWATILWEMNWELIDEYGFDPDIYTGTGGNNLALQLVTDGMKLQPCSPGFVDGRDAILQADVVLTGGANQCILWDAFARRGLGFSADQGSSGSTGDGTEAFDLPPLCLQILKITKTASPDPIAPGETLTYTLVAANDTLSPLTGIVISDVVPLNTTYVPGSASDGGSESGGVVTWPTIATMNSGDVVTRTFQVVVDGGVGSTVFFFDDFESGFGNWTMSGLWNPESESDTCGSQQAPFPSSTNAAYYGQDGVCDYNNGAANSGELTMNTPVMLTGVAPQLNFYSFEETEDFSGFDVRSVDISTDGGSSWTTLTELSNEGAWYQASVDLSAYVGNNILIRFQFDTVDGQFNDFFGWLVDDVLIIEEALISNTACVTASEGDNACDTVNTLVDVGGAPPTIDVDPDSMLSVQAQGTQVTQTLTINNTGDADLTWTIDEEPPTAAVVEGGWADNFDSYATGMNLHGVGGWKGWDNSPAATAFTSDTFANSAPNSVDISAASDLVQEYSGYTSGQWTYTAWQYIPTGYAGQAYFILLNTYNDGSPYNWSTQVCFNSGTGQVVDDPGATCSGTSLPIIFDQWVELRVEIDLDGNTQTFYYDNQMLFQDSWTEHVSGGGAVNIGAVDLFANSSTPIYYDDMSLSAPSTACTAPGDIPWLSVSPTSGTTAGGGSDQVDVAFDATATAVGTHTGTLCVSSNDAGNPLVSVPVTLTVTPPGTVFGVALSPDDAASGSPGSTASYTVWITNTGNVSDTFDLAVSGNVWTTTLSVSDVMLPPAASTTFNVDVEIPANAAGGDMDTATVTATSQGDPSESASTDLTTTALGGDPTIGVTPDSMSSTQAQDTQVTQALTINNFGGADLTWTIFEEPPAAAAVAGGWADDFDSYATGMNLHGVGGWKGWDNSPAATAFTSDTFANSAPNSVDISAASDLVQEYSGYTSGQWTYTAWQYIPTGYAGQAYFILLNTYNDGSPYNWSTQVCFNSGTGQVVDDPGATCSGTSLPIVYDQWVEIRVEIDLDGNTQTFYYDDQMLFQDSWTEHVSGGGAVNIGAVDLFANSSTPIYYDDMSLSAPGTDCMAPGDIPWLSASPTSGTTAGGGSDQVDVTFDSTGTAIGTHTGTLCVSSNDTSNPLVSIPVTLTVTPPGINYGVDLSPDDATSGLAGSTVSYTVWITNTGNVSDTFDLAVSGEVWTTTLSVSSVDLLAFATTSFEVWVEIPANASDGDMDTATVTATSQGDPSESDTADLTTTAVVITPPPTYGVDLSPDMAAADAPGATVGYTLWVTNTGDTTDTYTVTVSGVWTTTASVSSISLDAGASMTMTVWVEIPADASDGDMDTATVTVTSVGDPSVSDSADLVTTAEVEEEPELTIYLPFVITADN